MGVLERTSQVLRANINDLLNRAEDPEKMLNQIMRDMEDAIKQGQAQVAEHSTRLNWSASSGCEEGTARS